MYRVGVKLSGLAFLACAAAWGQTASLRGRVTDETGAVIPGARLEVKEASGPVRTTVANSEGSYSFSGLAPGDYTVRACTPELVLTLVRWGVVVGPLGRIAENHSSFAEHKEPGQARRNGRQTLMQVV